MLRYRMFFDDDERDFFIDFEAQDEDDARIAAWAAYERWSEEKGWGPNWSDLDDPAHLAVIGGENPPFDPDAGWRSE